MTHHFKSEKQALYKVISDIWELNDKPHRFINTLRMITEQFFSEKKTCLSKQGEQEIYKSLERLAKNGYPFNRRWRKRKITLNK